jgi:predicted metal-binding membrane protein
MDNQSQHNILTAKDEDRFSGIFIVISSLAFIISVTATIYFYFSMCCNMEMPGGWTMSMMWMQMPGDTWLTSFLSFILMWVTMMVAMMIPSALPMFLKTKRRWNFLCYTALGYFAVWLLAGVGVYVAGMMISKATMRSGAFSHAVPLLSGVILICAGTYQFTRLKITNLLHCRSQFGCGISTIKHETSFQLGCKQGIVCCICCSGLMIVELILGIMNPLVMGAVAIAIAAEKLLPQPRMIARLVGMVAIVAGIIITVHWALA